MKAITENEMLEQVLSDPNNFVAIYARESNLSAKNALEGQVDNCTRYLEKTNLIIYDVFSEHVSATQRHFSKRVEFKRLLEAAKKGCFKNIIVTKRDRLTRSLDEFYEIRNIFKNLGIKVLYSTDLDLSNTESYASNFIEDLLMAISEWEPQKIGDRVRDGQRIKRTKKIYDKKAPYGLRFNHITSMYEHDGLKALVIDRIFIIYKSSENITTAEQVILELNKMNDIAEEDKGQYKELIKGIDKKFIKDKISTPTYARLQTSLLEYKYSNFKVKFDGKEYDVDEDYFHECDNIVGFISRSEWIRVVQKWVKNNPTAERGIIINKKKDIKIFNWSITCKSCGKPVILVNKKLTCGGEKKCFRMDPAKLLNEVIKHILEKSARDGMLQQSINKATAELRKEKNKKYKQLACILEEQEKKIEKYISDKSNKEIIKEIEALASDQTKIKNEIEEIECRIDFLNNEFKNVIIPIYSAGHMELIKEDISDNELAILEMLTFKGNEELKANGHLIEIGK